MEIGLILSWMLYLIILLIIIVLFEIRSSGLDIIKIPGKKEYVLIQDMRKVSMHDNLYQALLDLFRLLIKNKKR